MTKPLTSPSRHRTAFAVILLFLLTFLTYLPALHAGYIWDDDWHVTNNQSLHSLPGLRDIWLSPSRPGHITIPQYYPLTHTTFWLEYHLWGLHPLGYHLDNVLLHAISALLLWRLLAHLNIPAPWFAAAIWAIHPLNVESVAWVTERKNVLSGLLYLASALTYLRPILFESEISNSKGSYFLSLFLFLLALLSKTVTSTLPAALLLVIWWKRGRLTWRDVLPLIPFFLLGATLGLHTSWMEHHVVGAAGPDWSFSPIDRLLIASRAACFYAAKLLFPLALSFNYERWTINPHLWWQWLFPLIVLGTLATLFTNRSRIGRAPLAATLFFLGTLTPALGFFDVYPMRYSFVADHFQYLAGIGPITLLVAGVARLSKPKRRSQRRAVPSVPILFVLTLATLTYARATAFHDAETLWRDTLAKNPGSWMANQNLGILLLDQGRLDDAESHFLRVIELKPSHVEARLRLAAVAEARHDPARAEHWYREAIAAEPTYAPDTTAYRETAVPHARLAIFLAAQNRPDEAIAEYEAALRIAPGYPLAVTNLCNLHTRLGVSLFRAGHKDEAVAHFRQVLAANPDSPDARANLDKALAARQTSPP